MSSQRGGRHDPWGHGAAYAQGSRRRSSLSTGEQIMASSSSTHTGSAGPQPTSPAERAHYDSPPRSSRWITRQHRGSVDSSELMASLSRCSLNDRDLPGEEAQHSPSPANAVSVQHATYGVAPNHRGAEHDPWGHGAAYAQGLRKGLRSNVPSVGSPGVPPVSPVAGARPNAEYPWLTEEPGTPPALGRSISLQHRDSPERPPPLSRHFSDGRIPRRGRVGVLQDDSRGDASPMTHNERRTCREEPPSHKVHPQQRARPAPAPCRSAAAPRTRSRPRRAHRLRRRSRACCMASLSMSRRAPAAAPRRARPPRSPRRPATLTRPPPARAPSAPWCVPASRPARLAPHA